MITVNIFGSCCSRELFNYSTDYKVNAYVQQNPIHTLNAKGYPIEMDDCISALGVNFIKRMIYSDFYKISFDLLFEQDSDYLMIDFADCRFGYYEIKGEENIRVAATYNTQLTLEKLKEKSGINYVFHSNKEITWEEWEEYLDLFLSKIKSKYDEKNIIINECTFAEKYVDKKGCVKQYSPNSMELLAKDLIIKIEQRAEEKLPGAHILKRLPEAWGNYWHRFGNIPLHYANYVYKYMIKQLDYILDVAANNIYQ